MKYLLIGFIIGFPIGFSLTRFFLFVYEEFADDLFYWFEETRIGKALLRWMGW
jgi:hypothetical protein